MDFKVDYKLGEIVMNYRYADDIILLATSEAELQELVDHLDRVIRKYSLLINVEKAKVMASEGIACSILIQNEQLEQMDTFPYLGSLMTEDGERTALNRGRRSCINAENMESHSTAYTDFNEDTTNESASVACSKVRL